VTPDPAPLAWRGATIGYDGRPVIDALDLRIEAGETVGILGANGSGKSTLVRGALGLATVQGGSVELFGTDRHRFRAWSRLGYVPQRETVTGGIPSTVREVVASGRLTSLRPFQPMRARDRRQVDDAIDAVGLASHATTSIATLSGGQQRRALIARALASGPDLLILDEPTAGVDHVNQQVLSAILASLRAAGTTIVLITHELGPEAPLVDRTVVLDAGTIVHDGPPSGSDHLHDHVHHEHGTTLRPAPRLGLGGIGGAD
jgi:zinc transport system ATP-binding protein